jgi:hypothetical protein
MKGETMKPYFCARFILIVFIIFLINADKHIVASVHEVEGMETEKYYKDLLSFAKCLSIVKNAGNAEVSEPGKYDTSKFSKRDNDVFETPKYWFSYEGWQSQGQGEKKALVTGYMAFLSILIKEEFCLDEEEKRQYDLFCKLVTVNDLVNHVDGLFKNPLYRDEGVQSLIYVYMAYNFKNYIGDPLMLPA